MSSAGHAHETGDRSQINNTAIVMLTGILVVLLVLTYVGVEAYVAAERERRVERTLDHKHDVELAKRTGDQKLELQGVHVTRSANDKQLEAVTTEKVGVPIDEAIATFVKQANP